MLGQSIPFEAPTSQSESTGRKEGNQLPSSTLQGHPALNHMQRWTAKNNALKMHVAAVDTLQNQLPTCGAKRHACPLQFTLGQCHITAVYHSTDAVVQSRSATPLQLGAFPKFSIERSQSSSTEYSCCPSFVPQTPTPSGTAHKHAHAAPTP